MTAALGQIAQLLTENNSGAIFPGVNLEHFLSKQNMTQRELADRCGVHPSMISQCLRNRRAWPASLAVKIERETQGAVAAKSLAPDLPW